MTDGHRAARRRGPDKNFSDQKSHVRQNKSRMFTRCHGSNCGKCLICWCPGAGSNHRHRDFQSRALPTELPGHLRPCRSPKGRAGVIEARFWAVQNG